VEFYQQLKYIRVHLGCTQKELAEMLGLSTGAIHKYEKQQMQPTMKTYNKVQKFIIDRDINFDKSFGTKTKVREGELTLNQQSKLIEYQQKEIEQLKEKINAENYKHIDSNTNYQFIIYASYKLDGLNIPTVTYLSNDYDCKTTCMQNWKFLSDRFGYSEKEIKDAWSLDNSYKYDEHPIHFLRNKKHKVGVIKQAVHMLTSMMLSKNTLDRIVFKLPVIYQHKNGSPIHCMNKYEVDTTAQTVLCKIHFMNGID